MRRLCFLYKLSKISVNINCFIFSLLLTINIIKHTFLLRLGMVGRNNNETVEKVKQLLKKSLETDFSNSNRVLKERMDQGLVGIFGSDGVLHLSIDAIWRSSTPDKKSFTSW